MALRDMNLDRLKLLLDNLQMSSVDKLEGEAKKLADFYNSMMDESAIEARGMEPLYPVLDLIKLGSFAGQMHKILAKLHLEFGVKSFFGVYSSPDKSNAEHTLLNLSQSGLGLPDKDYYSDEDKEEKRAKYIEYIETILSLVGAPSGISDPKAASLAVFEIEKKIAESHLTKTVMRDPEKTFNKMSVASLTETCGNVFDWREYLLAMGVSNCSEFEINVATVDAITSAVKIMTTALQ